MSWSIARFSSERASDNGMGSGPPVVADSAQNRSRVRAISETPVKPNVPADPASWWAVRSASTQPETSSPRAAASSSAAPRAAVRLRFVRRAWAVMVDSTLVSRSGVGGSAGGLGLDWSFTRPTP